MSQMETPTQPGLYIGGLRNDLHPAKLAGLLCSLLRRFQVQVANQCVHVNTKGNEAFCIIDLPDISVSHYLLSQLSSLDNVYNVFDLHRITFDPEKFKVGPKLTSSRRYRSRSRPNEKNEAGGSASVSASNSAHCSSSTVSNDSVGRFRSRSRSEERNKPQRPTAMKAHVSGSDLSTDTIGSLPKSNRASRRGRRKNRTGFSEDDSNVSINIYPAKSNQSDTNQPRLKVLVNSQSKGEDDDGISESDDDSSPVSKDPSSSSVLTKDSESKADMSELSLLQPGARLQAGGVRRLVQQYSVDPVSRSMSDRGMRPPVCRTSTTTSTTGLPLPSHVSVTTSTPGAGAGLVSNFYRLGQTIGRETRHSEFKQGGKAKDRPWLMETVGKYVCGFLNSSEGGTLYIGVNDSGIATGITCPQSKEDEYRLVIDDALKTIDPPIFTDGYCVRFIPLMEPSGCISDSLQVLEIEVKEIRGLNQLYVFRGNAFLRRDGSLQGPLKARQVQEWTRKRLERHSSSSLLKTQLHEMTSQLEKEREKTTRMQQQLRELEGYMSELTQELAHYQAPHSTEE